MEESFLLLYVTLWDGHICQISDIKASVPQLITKYKVIFEIFVRGLISCTNIIL